jgi:hypothetical protein
MVNDLPGTLLQIRRALAPDGLFLACIMVAAKTLEEIAQRLRKGRRGDHGGASPRVAPFADLRDMGALLQRAGFALPVTDIDTITARYANLFALMADLRATGARPMLFSQRLKRPLRRDLLLRSPNFMRASIPTPTAASAPPSKSSGSSVGPA